MKLNPREAGQRVRDRAVSREGKVVTTGLCVMCRSLPLLSDKLMA